MTSWIAKLFPRNNQPAHRTAPQPHKAPRLEDAPHSSGLSLVDDSPSRKKGFDPYNSGSFERTNAWERVVRR